MDIKNKIRKYHKKKLYDALAELKFHKNVKNRLESELISASNDESKLEITRSIAKQNNIICIWEKNIEKINKQLEKIK